MKKGMITLIIIGLVAIAGTASAGWFGHSYCPSNHNIHQRAISHNHNGHYNHGSHNRGRHQNIHNTYNNHNSRY